MALGLNLAVGLCVLLTAWAGQRYLAAHLDLRDLPGPASGHIMTLAALGGWDAPGVDGHLCRAIAWLGGDPVDAMRRVMSALGLLGVLGALLGGAAFAGRAGAWTAGLLAATWSQSLFLSLMISYDTAGYAAGWLGLGLALFAVARGAPGPVEAARVDGAAESAPGAPSRSRWWLKALRALPREALWLSGLWLGGMLVVYGLGAKEVAHPLLPMLIAAPLLVRRGWWRAVLASAVVAWVCIYGLTYELRWQLVNPRAPRHIRALPELAPDHVLDGLNRMIDLLQVGPGLRVNVLLPLSIVALVGALWPGRRWLSRVTLGLTSLVSLGLSYDLIGDWMRLRYLAVPSLPVLLLAAVALVLPLQQLARWRWLKPLVYVPGLVVAALLFADTLDYGRTWSAIRGPFTEITQTTLMAPPSWPWHQNGSPVGTNFGDFTVTGGVGAFEIIRASQLPSVAVLPIRDSRESSLVAVAALSGKPYTVLDPPSCCPGGLPSAECAARVVSELDAAGALMMLPRLVQNDPRRTLPVMEGWRAQLKDAAIAAGAEDVGSRYWWALPGRGAGGALPCNPGAPASPLRPR